MIHPRSWQLSPQVQQAYPHTSDALGLATAVTLGPGDALYLPPFWAHHVVALGDDENHANGGANGGANGSANAANGVNSAHGHGGGQLAVSLNVFSTSRVWEQSNRMAAYAPPRTRSQASTHACHS